MTAACPIVGGWNLPNAKTTLSFVLFDAKPASSMIGISLELTYRIFGSIWMYYINMFFL
jgi:hypothetical protein